jgi:hypothetical protein
VPWSSWNFRMTVGGFVKTSMLGSVLSESLTDSTAFRKCLVGGLPRHHTQTFASKPSVSSANSCLGQGGNADVRITRLFETVWADVKFAERGLRKKSRIPRRSTCQRAAQQRSIRWSRSLRNNLWVACGYRLD